MVGRDGVTFVDDDGVGVGNLQVRGRHVHSLVLVSRYGFLVQAQEYVLGVDKRDDAVEVDGAAQAVVDPEKRGQVARVREPGRLEEDVVKGAAARHEGFNRVDARVLDGAADAAVGQLEPLLRLLAVLRDGEGSLDVGGCIGRTD